MTARDNASPAFRKVGDSAERAGKQASGFGTITAKAMASAAGAIAGLALGRLFTGFIEDARESARVSRLTEAVLKSTGGAAHITAKQVGELATAISNKTGIDDEQIQSAENLLLTFTKVRNEVGKGNDVFDQATQLAVDMSVVLGGEASDSAKQLGKALNDPIKGITALSRAGVSFTAQQKEQIKAFVEAGDILSAQKIILQELGTEFGGAAEAASDPLQRLGTIAGNLGEDIGGLLLPAIEGFANFAADDLVPAIKSAAGWLGETFGPALGAVKDAVVGVVDVGADIVGFFNDLPGPIKAGVVALGAIVLLKGPISTALETIALKALYAKDAITGISLTTGSLKKVGAGLLGAFGGPVGLAITGITVGLGFLVSALSDAKDSTSDATEAQQTYTDALKATNGVIDDSVRRAAAQALQQDHLLDFVDLYGVKSSDLVGYVLGEADAHDAVTEALDRYRDSLEGKLTGDKEADAVTQGLIGAVDQHIAALDGLANSTDSTIASERQLAEATGDTTAATRESTQALDDWLKKLQGIAEGFTEPLSIYEDLLSHKQDIERESAQATADATESSSDSWEDYVTNVGVSLDEYAASLEEQLADQDAWRENIGIIAQRAGTDVANYLAEMGDRGIDIVSDMATGTDAEVQRMAEAILADIQHGGAEWTASMQQQTDFMAAVGRQGARATVAGIAAELGLGTNAVRRIAQQYGVELAGGVNPILTALGKGTLRFTNSGVVASVNAAGNLYENHSAEIAPGGAWRIWAEPETGGEAYIPLAASKRGRSIDIWRQVGDRLGVNFAEFADGGFASAASVPKPPSTAPYGVPISTAGDAAMRREYDETVAWLQQNLTSSVFGPVPGAPAASGGNVGLVQAMAAIRGWTGGQWDALYQLVMHESGFRNTAQNPTSTAYGMFQFLDSTWAGYGYSKTSDPKLQTLAGFNYIASKYGSPAGAWDFWQGHHWYDDGGILPPGVSLAYNGTGKPETVRTAEQEADLHRGGELRLTSGWIEIRGDGMARIAGRVVREHEYRQGVNVRSS